jgi:hypothetical protein
LEIVVPLLEDRSNRIRPLLVVAIALLVGAVIVFTIVNRPKPHGQWSVEAIQSEYREISLPEGTRALGGLDVLAKYGVTAVSGRYEAPNTGVLQHYRAELVGHGWTYVGDFHAGQHWGESYCKAKLLARVELFNAKGNGPYAFSMSWGDVSEQQCP